LPEGDGRPELSDSPGTHTGAERRGETERREKPERRSATELFASADRRSNSERRREAARRAKTERPAGPERRTEANRRLRTNRSWLARRRNLVIVCAAVVIVLAVAIAFAVDRTHGDGSQAGRTTSGNTSVAGSSPYDLTEAPASADLKIIKGAKFVSIDLLTSGKLTSYSLDAALPGMKSIQTAILKAKRSDAVVGPTGNSITFVTSDRQTVTFTLDLDQGLVSRGGVAWKPQDDIKALVLAATTTTT